MHESCYARAAARIARFSCEFRSHHFDRATYSRQVARALIDTVAVALAARNEPVARIMGQYVANQSVHTATATAWGKGINLSAEDAALYNAAAGHVLDYDDVNGPLRGHPSIILIPSLVALAQERDLDGARLASAYTVGFEAMVRLARALVQDHYAKGWHATTTLGTIGSAVACCHLLGLSEAATSNAIGLAVAQSSGTRANFGTMAKSFQTAHSAACAVRAAVLAELGMTASPDALDGELGFSRLYGNGESLEEALQDLGQPLELLHSGIEIKKYPMCYAAHRAIDGMLDLRAAHALSPAAILSIRITSSRRGMIPLIHDAPQTGLQAKFSMQYAMAAAMLDGHVRLSSFTDEAVRRPAIRDLMAKVSKSEADGPPAPRWITVEVALRTGEVLAKTVTQLRGSSELPLSDDDLREKWRDCLDYGGLADDSAFFDAAMQLDCVRIRDLMARLPGQRT